MEFKDNFSSYAVPKILNDLFVFQSENTCFRMFSQGFGLRFENYDNFFSDKFKNTFIPFAVANSSGATYGFWVFNDSGNLTDFPIVIFGDEGGINLIAENIFLLLSNLTLDIEPLIDYFSNTISFNDAYYEESVFLEKYKKWLYLNGLEFTNKTICELTNELKLLQNKYKIEFEDWKSKYYDNL